MKRLEHPSRTAVGKVAEDAAVEHLGSLGFEVVRRNLRGPGGEIDIVAKDGDVVVFVEVKARSNHAFGSAIGAVDSRKRRRIRAIAEDFLQVAFPSARARFDVLTVEPEGITLHRNAFSWP